MEKRQRSGVGPPEKRGQNKLVPDFVSAVYFRGTLPQKRGEKGTVLGDLAGVKKNEGTWTRAFSAESQSKPIDTKLVNPGETVECGSLTVNLLCSNN